MSRTVIGLAAVVLIGLGALWYLVLRDDPTPAASDPAAAPVATARSTGPGPSLPAAGTPVPTLHSTGRPQAKPDMTGMEMRDHRGAVDPGTVVGSGSGSAAPPPPPHVPPVLARAIYHNASSVVLACARKIDKADRGASPHLGAKLKVEIKDGTVHVLDAIPEAVDLTGAAVEDAKKCVHDYFVNIELPTNDDSADVGDAELSLSYAVR